MIYCPIILLVFFLAVNFNCSLIPIVASTKLAFPPLRKHRYIPGIRNLVLYFFFHKSTPFWASSLFYKVGLVAAHQLGLGEYWRAPLLQASSTNFWGSSWQTGRESWDAMLTRPSFLPTGLETIPVLVPDTFQTSAILSQENVQCLASRTERTYCWAQSYFWCLLTYSPLPWFPYCRANHIYGCSRAMQGTLQTSAFYLS